LRALGSGIAASLLVVSPAPAVLGQDLAPRAYLITPVKSTAVTMAYSFNDGELLLERAAPITDATGRLNVPNVTCYHSLALLGRSANLTVGLAYGVGNLEGTVLGRGGRPTVPGSSIPSFASP
jgi:hypothetical protein